MMLITSYRFLLNNKRNRFLLNNKRNSMVLYLCIKSQDSGLIIDLVYYQVVYFLGWTNSHVRWLISMYSMIFWCYPFYRVGKNYVHYQRFYFWRKKNLSWHSQVGKKRCFLWRFFSVLFKYIKRPIKCFWEPCSNVVYYFLRYLITFLGTYLCLMYVCHQIVET